MASTGPNPEVESVAAAFRAHSHHVRKGAASVTRCPASQDDIIQVVFLRLLRKGLGDRIVEASPGYFVRAGRNAALNWVRRDRREAERRLQNQDPPQAGHSDPVLPSDLHLAVGSAVDKTPPPRAMVARLFFLED